MYLFCILAAVVLGGWILNRSLIQQALQTSAKAPATLTPQTLSALSAASLSKADIPNSRQSTPFASTVEPSTGAPTLHKNFSKRPNRQPGHVPDLEVENALDDASSDPFLSGSEDASDTLNDPRGVAPSSSETGSKTTRTNAGSLPEIRVTLPESIALGLIIERIKPDYPEGARAQHVHGPVVIDVIVGRDGQVKRLSPVEGDSQLLASATKAVGLWRFTPFIRNGNPVSFESHITLNFALP